VESDQHDFQPFNLMNTELESVRRPFFLDAKSGETVPSSDQTQSSQERLVEELYRAFWGPLFGFLIANGQCHYDAEDLVEGCSPNSLRKGLSMLLVALIQDAASAEITAVTPTCLRAWSISCATNGIEPLSTAGRRIRLCTVG